MPDAALECRGFGHVWPRSREVPFGITESDKRGRAKICVRRVTCKAGCGTSKTAEFKIHRDGYMERLGTRYEYGETYLMKRPAANDGADVLPLPGRSEVQYALLTHLYPSLEW